MIVQVVSCNHQHAGLEVRERLAFSSQERLREAYDSLRARFPSTDFVVLSTCNRVELYSAHEEIEPAPTAIEIARFFSEFHHVPLDDFVDVLFERTGPEAVRHLFEVVCSLDSMVLGEPQIVSQVKEAYAVAVEQESCGPLTNVLFQRALAVSARVRSETKLVEGKVSIASVAVGEFGRSIFESFAGRTVLVLGAGEMAGETLRYLVDEGASDVVVVNRSLENARRLAAEWGGRARPIEELDAALGEADVIVSTTGAPVPIVTAERFRRVRSGHGDRPVFVLDLGAPRDFEPAAAEVDDNVFLYDIDDLEATCDRNRRARAKEIEHARKIVREEADRFLHDVYHRATGPVVKRLRDEWHEIKDRELQLLFERLENVDAAERAAIERAVDRIVNKLLHPPLQALRDESRDGTPHGLLHAMKRLFHLGE
jgi:glutamyl-tRNA reductase